MQKVFEWIGETYVLKPNFIEFAAMQPQLFQVQSHSSFVEFIMENKVWGSFSQITF